MSLGRAEGTGRPSAEGRARPEGVAWASSGKEPGRWAEAARPWGTAKPKSITVWPEETH